MATVTITFEDDDDAQEVRCHFNFQPRLVAASRAHAMAGDVLEMIAEMKRATEQATRPAFDLVAHLARQRAFSERTFGPGPRTKGVIEHIRKELAEIEAEPGDISEWVDVVLLALDGAWRAGFSPEQIAEAIAAKQAKNEARQWPDWRTVPADQAIEHRRDEELAK